MKKRVKIIIALIVVMMMSVVLTISLRTRNGGATVSGSNNFIEVVAKKASESASGCNITVKKGEKLVVKSNVEKGSIRIKLSRVNDEEDISKLPIEIIKMINNKDEETEFDETFTAKGTYKFELPEGKYQGLCMFGKKLTTGNIVIESEAE